MVHIEEKSTYISRLRDAPSLKPIIDELLLEQVQNLVEENHNASNVALNLLICLRKGDGDKAKEIYVLFSRRQPTRESHWIYDDFILFAIICAVRKFGLSEAWIRGVIDLGYTSGSEGEKIIRDTFKNILAGNLNVKGDRHQISLVYQFFSGHLQYDNVLINALYQELWRKEFPFYDEDFLNVISIKALEIILLSKGLLSPQEMFETKEFVQRFTLRVESISNIAAWLLVLTLTGAVYYTLWKLNLLGDKDVLWGKFLNFSISIFGVGISAFLGLRKAITTLLKKALYFVFGYRSFSSEAVGNS